MKFRKQLKNRIAGRYSVDSHIQHLSSELKRARRRLKNSFHRQALRTLYSTRRSKSLKLCRNPACAGVNVNVNIEIKTAESNWNRNEILENVSKSLGVPMVIMTGEENGKA